MEYDFYLISKTQNVFRLQKKRYVVHFPVSYKRPLCGKYTTYRHLRFNMLRYNQQFTICEDCLTHAGEH